MIDVLGVLLFSLGLLYFLYIAFIVWLKPRQYMRDIHERRISLKAKFPYIPNWFIGLIFFLRTASNFYLVGQILDTHSGSYMCFRINRFSSWIILKLHYY